MKKEITKMIKAAYEKDDLNRCVSETLALALVCNAELRHGKDYNHDLKETLASLEETSGGSEKTQRVLSHLLELMQMINNREMTLPGASEKELVIDNRIIEDVSNMAA